MNSIILTMSLSGTICLLLFYICRFFFKTHFSSCFFYRLLKLALWFYLLPIPPLIRSLKIEIRALFPIGNAEEIFQIYYNNTIYIATDGTYIFPPIYKLVLGLLLLWILVLSARFMRQLFLYFRLKKSIVSAQIPCTQPNEDLFFALKEQVGVKQKVKLYTMDDIPSPFTIGLFSPRIILPRKPLSSKDISFMLQHELYHIKHHDFLIKILGLSVVAIHWFNPFSYLLFYELSRIQECACDERVVSRFDKAETIAYGSLILNTAAQQANVTKPLTQMPVSAFASSSKNMLKERILNMKHKKSTSSKKVFLSALLFISFTCISSFPAFAYHPPTRSEGHAPDDKFLIGIQDGTADTLITNQQMEELINEDDTDFPDANVHTDSDEYYVDENGQLFETTDIIDSTSTRHSHLFQKAHYVVHVKNSSGGCSKEYYTCSLCKYCGHTRNKKFIGKNSYFKCTH